jgi:hypothetical protein
MDFRMHGATKQTLYTLRLTQLYISLLNYYWLPVPASMESQQANIYKKNLKIVKNVNFMESHLHSLIVLIIINTFLYVLSVVIV